MEASEVQDEESLRRYLGGLPEDERHDVALRVAFRAAARALPDFAWFLTVHSENDTNTNQLLSVLAVTLAAEIETHPSLYVNDASVVSAVRAAISGGLYSINALATALAVKDHYIHAIASIGQEVHGWSQIGADLPDVNHKDLLDDGAPSEFSKTWRVAKTALQAETTADWSFWILWYERVLAGWDTLPDALAPIFNRLTEDDWEKGPAHINPLFDGVLAMYRADDARVPALADAAPVEFTFDALAKVMRMIGIDDTTAHLRQPEIVQAFLDDAEQVQELFEDFVEDAKTLAGGGNYAGLLQRKAEKILAEFQRTADKTHLRAEMLVIKASELEVFAKDAKTRADLGDTLADHLDTRIMLLKRLCRDHFGPSYAVLAPLADLNFDHIDQAEVLRIIDSAIAKVDALPTDGIYPLDAEGRAILHDMRRELDDFRAAIAEASSDAFRAVLEQRMAQSAGALGLTLTRFAKRSVEAAGNVERGIGVTKRVKDGINDLNDIAAWVLDIFKWINS